MRIRGSHVAVVGGSIAGCAAALALRRSGCRVTVFERSAGGLRDRGAGITLPASRYDELLDAGYLSPTMPVRRRGELIWLTRDEQSADGRIVGRQPYPSIMASWALVWRGLREQVPDEDYHDESTITGIRNVEHGVELSINSAPAEHFDAVIGADGYKSTVRGVVAPESDVRYGGYGLWRGDYPVDRVPGPGGPALIEDFVAVGYHGGHVVYYQIPDQATGGLRQNWAVYGSVPPWLYAEQARPVPRGQVDDASAAYLEELIARELPPAWADVIRLTEQSELSINPMYDATMARYTRDRIVLLGDAGALARPHTGAGAVKAIEDALALEKACAEAENWAEALSTYDEARRVAGNTLTRLGQHLGQMRVVNSPDWSTLTEEDFQSWLHTNTHGWQSAYDRS
jgi:2-polyprenyl-6-methoxyphenol hydroxylase-like FAD-dependent oxidoreductase